MASRSPCTGGFFNFTNYFKNLWPIPGGGGEFLYLRKATVMELAMSWNPFNCVELVEPGMFEVDQEHPDGYLAFKFQLEWIILQNEIILHN